MDIKFYPIPNFSKYEISECGKIRPIVNEQNVSASVSPSILLGNLRNTTNNIFYGSFVFRYEDDERPWPNLTAADIGKYNCGTSKPVLAKRLSDGNIYVTDSINAMAKLTGVKMATIASRLRKGCLKECFGYIFKDSDDRQA